MLFLPLFETFKFVSLFICLLGTSKQLLCVLQIVLEDLDSLLLLVDHLLALGELEGPGLPSQAVRVQPNSLVEVAVAWGNDKNMTLAILLVSFTIVEGTTLV